MLGDKGNEQRVSPANLLLWMGKTGGYVLALTLLLSGQSLLITYSKGTSGYAYNPTTTILLAEILKFFISIAMMYYQGIEIGFRLKKDTLPYCAPALIYFVQNNLVFLALIYVDATTYQVLVNLKIITTGILFRFVLGKHLSSLQWCALVLLTIGCATSQLSSNCADSPNSGTFAISVEGIIICVLLSILSAAAGIITEWIMKKSILKSDPLQRQNMHLYFFGTIFNFLGYLISPDSNKGKSFFDGYDFVTILIIMSYSFSGLTVSFIMKHADNMVKIYAVAVSMALTMVLSVLIFPEFHPTIQLLFGIIIITISILQYFNLLSGETGSAVGSSVNTVVMTKPHLEVQINSDTSADDNKNMTRIETKES